MKRWLTVLLALTMAISLAACGENSNETENGNLPQVTSPLGDSLPKPDAEQYKNYAFQHHNHCSLTVSDHLIEF